MAESSRFWTTNNTGDGPTAGYSAANFQQFVRETFITDTANEGVLYGIGNALAVSGTSSPVAVASGAALVYGFYYTNDASLNVTIPTPASNPRIDRIVLRVSWAAQTVRITRIAGTEAASPSAPAMTQVANTTWDIPLATVQITTGGACTVTDGRTFVKHPGVYGWLNTNLSVNGSVSAVKSSSGTYVESVASNTSNTAGSYARHLSKVGGASADDPLFVWEINGVLAWAMGLDNSDSDKMKIAPFSVIGSGDVLTLDSSGNLTVTGALSASSLNASQLGSGTVPLARLSGISTSQLDAAAGIVTGQIANDAIDDTKVGNRVPQFYRRQGGSATDWDSAGTTTYTPGMVRMQSGVIAVTLSASAFGSTAVTFPVAFSAKPNIICGIANSPGSGILFAPQAQSISTTGFTAYIAANTSLSVTVNIGWFAIGPE